MLKKHSITIRGHQTSYTLENEFYTELQHLAKQADIPLARMITAIDENRPPDTNLSSALRLHILRSLKQEK